MAINKHFSQILSGLESWPTTVSEARSVQEALRGRVQLSGAMASPRLVGGVDVGLRERGRLTRAAAVVLDYPGLTLVESSVTVQPTCFPYVPGYLSFREVPAVLRALAALKSTPDVILCDGQGYAHPRRFGLACHLGVLIDMPTVGVAKSRLIGEHAPLPLERGAWVPLYDGGECVGAVVRTREGVKPLYVSVGHKLSLSAAIDLVLGCAPRFRLPETTRQADRLASHVD